MFKGSGWVNEPILRYLLFCYNRMTLKDYINGETPTLIDFSAEWCGPCHVLSPIVKDVKKKFGEKVNILKVDIDKNQPLAELYNIQMVPTLILFRAGNILWRQSGVMPAQQLYMTVAKYV